MTIFEIVEAQPGACLKKQNCMLFKQIYWSKSSKAILSSAMKKWIELELNQGKYNDRLFVLVMNLWIYKVDLVRAYIAKVKQYQNHRSRWIYNLQFFSESHDVAKSRKKNPSLLFIPTRCHHDLLQAQMDTMK